MATAILNPAFVSISGRMGNVVFYRRKKTQCIRMYVVPRNPDTILQRNSRSLFADAVKSWQALTKEEKYKYTRKARGTRMSGYNLYISGYLRKTSSVKSKPEFKLKSNELLYSSSECNRFHSVSASLSKSFRALTAFKLHHQCRGSTLLNINLTAAF